MLARVFIIFHDYQHHTILQKSPLAKVLFTVFGVYMITPPSIWKRSHDHHHNHNSKLFSASIGSYPIMTKRKFEEASKSEQRSYLAVRYPLTDGLCLLYHVPLRDVPAIFLQQSPPPLGFTGYFCPAR